MRGRLPEPASPKKARALSRWCFRMWTLPVLVAGAALLTWEWRLLTDPDAEVRAASWRVGSGSHGDRQAAVHTLRLSDGRQADLALPSLAAATRDADHDVRLTAVGSLSGVFRGSLRAAGPEPGQPAGSSRVVPDTVRERTLLVTGALLGRLRDGAADIREEAVRGLDQVYTQGEVIDLATPRGDQPPAVDSGPIFDALAGALADADASVRARSAAALGHLAGHYPARAPRALIEATRDESAEVRRAAARSLTQFAGDIDTTLPHLFRLIEEGGEPQDAPGLSYAVTLTRPSAVSVPFLTRQLASPDVNARKAAAGALGAIGPPARSAVGALVGVLGRVIDSLRAAEDPEATPGAWTEIPQIVRAVRWIDPEGPVVGKELVPLFLKALQDGDSLLAKGGSQGQQRRGYRLWYAGRQGLEELGPQAESAVPAVLAIVNARKEARARDKERFPGDDDVYLLAKLARGTRWAGEAAAVIAAVLNDGRLHDRQSFDRYLNGLAGSFGSPP